MSPNGKSVSPAIPAVKAAITAKLRISFSSKTRVFKYPRQSSQRSIFQERSLRQEIDDGESIIIAFLNSSPFSHSSEDGQSPECASNGEG